MKPFAGWILIAMLAGMTPAYAQVYKWVGPDGKIHYGDTPPPSSATKSQPQTVSSSASSSSAGKVDLPYELAEAVKKNPVTLYSSANCTPCDNGRTLLRSRGVPFSEKTVRTTDDVVHLRNVSGDSQVPVLIVGARKLPGFVASEWEDSLSSAGYPTTNKLPKTYRYPPPEAAAPLKEEPAPSAAAPEQAAPLPEPPSPSGNAPPGFRF